MSELITWQGSKVDVQARLIPRFLWSTASIDVFLDGDCILRTGGQMKATGSQVATFSHSGTEHEAELSWGVGFFWSFPYQLRIDGAPIAVARFHVQNWPLGLLRLVLLAAGLILFFRFVRRG